MKSINQTPLILTLLAAILLSGCEEDQRVAEVAREAAQRQAEQNREMTNLNREVAESHKRLVEADAAARKEVLTLQQQLVQRESDSQQRFDQQHHELEQERREIATQRNRDPIIAATLTSLGVLLACLVPLLLVVYLVRAAKADTPSDAELAELLITEIASSRPVLLPEASPLPADRGLERPALAYKDNDPGSATSTDDRAI